MPYDSALDEKIFSKSWEGNGTRLIVSIYAYNKGAQKIQISRELIADEGKSTFAKLGRLTKEELEAILPLLREALEVVK